MDPALYISRFLYRIRYQIIFGSLIAAALVAYFTQFLPKTYTVNTSIYTGIASKTGLEGDDKLNIIELNNTFDNVINLTKAKGTLEKVSIKLFALNMIHGNPDKDNLFITAKNFRVLEKIVPKEVSKLIIKDSLDKTIDNLYKFKEEIPGNFLFELFNSGKTHYSYKVLQNVLVKRLSNSDLIEISYKSTDPGIALSTVKLINEELVHSYDGLRFKATNDVVSYYEGQLKKLKTLLDKKENDLTNYNIENGVINYSEQTKAIAIARSNYEDRYEDAQKEYEASSKLVAQLEKQMDTRAKLFKANNDFINTLNDISTINGKITEIEMFSTEDAQKTNPLLSEYKEDLKKSEKTISQLSNDMNEYKYSKEGVAIDDMVSRWLEELLKNIKAKAYLKILEERKSDFETKYKILSPVGTQINRKERDIRVTEESYLEVLHALNLAKLKQKNIQLTSATLSTITPPSFPIVSDGQKRMLFTVAAFIGSIIFIIGCNLIIELLDRTLRDAERTRRLTNTPVLGAFTGNTQLKHRGYVKACNRISAAYACNRLNQYLHQHETTYINLLSIEDREGKSFVAKYLVEQWKESGLKVEYRVAGKDFSIDSSFILAKDFHYFNLNNEVPDILLIEHTFIQNSSIPIALLKKADVNLLVVNAVRVWKNSDEEYLNHLKEVTGTTPLYIYLNNARREAVEDFTGQLPPKTSIHSLANRMMYLGLTANDSAVK
ncbi:hypothetical protein [Parabacteroides chongii]|uniref:hypothetical protein n=1 Tax=Parabacteroides chongii TaxID=2685834 RepID=UPI00240CF117|nr:hypothetical protein [Parabacteroides chongii]WFE83642.1 hypothetical protein P3L47_16025 [Parabacteroides chongii]